MAKNSRTAPRPPRPAPTQSQANEIAENNATGAPVETKEEVVDTTPRPTQAELDEMKAGTFDRYKTR